MPHKNALSLSEGNLDIKTLLHQSQLKKLNTAQPACCSNKILGLTVSLATAAMYLPISSQPAFAADLAIQTKTSAIELQNPIFPSQIDRGSAKWQNQSSPFLPPILSLIASLKTQLVNLSVVPQESSQSESVVLSDGLDNTLGASLLPTYPSQTKINSDKDFQRTTRIKSSGVFSTSSASVKKPTPQIYTVKVGDTINQIAKKHQVSRDELIKLNHLKNSNIIFVNQQLQIPPKISDSFPTYTTTDKQEKNLTSDDFSENTESKLSNSLKQSGANQPRESSNNHYVAKLRAEINQMRTQYQDQIGQRQASNKVNQEISSNLPSLSSVNTANTSVAPKTKDKNTSTAKVKVASLDSASSSPELDSLAEEITSLQLPPLLSSEQYLPSTFDGYSWPAKGILTSGYGWRWGRLHGGIDIAAPIGTPILAAASGEVISAGWVSGYGNQVKIRHLDNSVTVYAHNHRNLVSLGQKVNQGEQIAEIGNTGYSTGPHLHFEIHPQGLGAVNPLALLDSK